MMLYFIGLAEMVIATTWTRFVSRGQLFASSMITFVNILIWYYVLRQIISDLGDWSIVVLYAAGCATGTMIAMYVFEKNDKQEMTQGNE